MAYDMKNLGLLFVPSPFSLQSDAQITVETKYL